MDIREDWFNIEYLVFSAHKTATQTITNSLNFSGVRSRHAHVLYNMELKKGEFRFFLQYYRKRNNQKLKIISAFRDPMERLISSFFQSLEENPYAWVVPDNEDKASGEFNMAFIELQDLFYQYCKVVDGWGESVTDICNELDISIESLNFSEKDFIGLNETEDCFLYLLRFDLMLPYMANLLKFITGHEISLRVKNVSSAKSYAHKYIEFQKLIKMPRCGIAEIYESRKRLLDLFYPGQYESLLKEKIRRYGK